MKSSVADPDIGSGAFLTPGSGKEKFGSGINIPDRNTDEKRVSHHLSCDISVLFSLRKNTSWL